MSLVTPVAGPIVQPFNSTITGEVHHGIDIAADPGTPVVAPVDGTVLFAGFDDSGVGGGLMIRMVGDDQWQYVLVHLGSVSIGAGARVAAGQTIGTVAQPGTAEAGNAHQAHLHFQVEAGRGNYIDPAPLLGGAVGVALAGVSSSALAALALLAFAAFVVSRI